MTSSTPSWRGFSLPNGTRPTGSRRVRPLPKRCPATARGMPAAATPAIVKSRTATPRAQSTVVVWMDSLVT